MPSSPFKSTAPTCGLSPWKFCSKYWVACQKDFCLLVDFKLEFKSLYTNLYVRASQRPALILRSFTSRDLKLLTKAFCTYVRPMLEYESSIWSRVCQSDIYIYIYIYIYTNRYRNISPNNGFSNFNDIERLKRFSIDTLETQRLCCDLYYKLQNDI